MMLAFSKLLAFFLLSALTNAANVPCGTSCNFRLCKQDGTLLAPGKRVLLRSPGEGQDPSVCLPGSILRTVRTTGEALVFRRKNPSPAVPISSFSPATLNTPYPTDYFQLFPIMFNLGDQGVGRRAAQGNQYDFLDKLCVVLPITKYIVEDGNGVATTINTSDPDDCIGFSTTAPAILIEIEWDSSADLDIHVDEPDGDELFYNNEKTEAGILNNDLVPTCGSGETGKENALYRMGSNIESGEYTVRIVQFDSCSETTNWVLRISVDGAVVASASGTASPNDVNLVTRTFTI